MQDKVIKSVAYILDDDPGFVALMSALISKFRVTLESFSEPESLLKKVAETIPSLCIIDLNLSAGKKGTELIKPLRASSYNRLPIFIVSSSRDIADIRHAVTAGANDFLVKPIDKDVLANKLYDFFSTAELSFANPSFSKTVQTQVNYEVSLEFQIIGISESDVTLSSKHSVSKDLVLTVNSEFFHKIINDKSPLKMRTLSSEQNVALGTFETKLEFVEIDDAKRKLVSEWIKAHK